MKTTQSLIGLFLIALVVLVLGGPRAAQALEPFHSHPKHFQFRGAPCANCHSTHRPEASKLLKDSEVKVCRICHNHADTIQWKVHERFKGKGKGRFKDRDGWNPPFDKDKPEHGFAKGPFPPAFPNKGGKGYSSSPKKGKGKKSHP